MKLGTYHLAGRRPMVPEKNNKKLCLVSFPQHEERILSITKGKH